MGKRRRRRNRDSWWLRQYGGMPAWGLVAAAAVVLGAGAWALSSIPDAVEADPTRTARPVEPIVAPTRTPLPPMQLPQDAQVLAIGDSFVEGFGANDPAQEGWVPLVADAMGWDVMVNGRGGTGYLWGGGDNGDAGMQYINRVREFAADNAIQPDLVLLQGGPNDYRFEINDLRTAVGDTIRATKEAWPDAEIVVVGIAAPGQSGRNLRPYNTAILDAARFNEVRTIDVTQRGWVTGSDSADLTAEDGGHLNTAGYALLAEHITTVFRDEWSAG